MLFWCLFLLLLFHTVQRPLDIKNRPRIPIPDEDPYSVAENVVSSGGSSGSSGFIANGSGMKRLIIVIVVLVKINNKTFVNF